MPNRVTLRRGRILAQAGTVAVLAGLAAACSSNGNGAKEPFFTGSTPNQQAIIAGQNTQVANAALPMPPGTAGGPVNLAGAPAGGYNSGGGAIVVAPGETLEIIAMRYGVPVQDIAQANGITSPAQVTPGRALVIPQPGTTVAYASADTLAPPVQMAAPAPVSAGGVVHIVEPGQTLFGISQAQGVSMQDIMTANGMTSQTVRIGQRLKIPGGGGMAPVQTAALGGPGSQTLGAPPQTLGTLPSPGSEAMPTTAPAVQAVAPAAPPVPEVPAVAAPAAEPVQTAAVDATVDPPSTNGTSFRWPVRGRIISDFGAKPTGERNDGINLAVPEGTAVKAAEAGTVIYAGNELAGYGNLVLVRHADGWVTAYAHNSNLSVSKGDNVQRGQTIALAGATGSVTSPQVHFELRKGAKPVNPLDYLSGT